MLWYWLVIQHVFCFTRSTTLTQNRVFVTHDDVIKWRHFPRYWPFVRGIHRSPVNSHYKSRWRGALMFSLISTWTNGWVKNREAGDLRRHRPIVTSLQWIGSPWINEEQLLTRLYSHQISNLSSIINLKCYIDVCLISDSGSVNVVEYSYCTYRTFFPSNIYT